MNNRKNRLERNLRNALGLPSDDLKVIGVAWDDSVSENTMTSKCGMRGAPSGQFDYGASGGAASPNTEVNAEGRTVRQELPEKR